MKANNSMFINRELSWLEFNTRVLNQSTKNIPILERLKFISIYCTNLDEFYMIRVAGLKQLFAAGISTSELSMTPLEQLKAIRTYLHEEKKTLEKNYHTIIDELKKEKVFITNYEELSKSQKRRANDYFFSNILPVIVPIAVDSTHPFPPLNNLSFSIALKLKDSQDDEIIKFAMIRIPRVLPRFFEADDFVFVPVESIVIQHIEDIFPGYSMVSSLNFRVTRNADIVIEEEEADDFMMMLEQGLRLRRKGAFVRMQVEKNPDKEILDFLINHTKIFVKDIYEYDIPLNLSALMQIVNHKALSHLNVVTYSPKVLPPFDENISIFDTLDKTDVLCYQPYESFNPVNQLVKEASKDPKVVCIRMTLYRVEKNSSIVKSLIDAANDGKQVTVMVELKARFDEENNLHWAKELENAGAHVVYGITGFKVHAKVIQIIRQNADGLRFYAHISTGNYNASSAKIYTDISYFTTKENIANYDITSFFHILSGFSKKRVLKTMSMSPNQIKDNILKMINKEASMGENGEIIMKMNSLVDESIIKALYNASSKGVKISLIVRGVCCLRTAMDYSKNIVVKSIVGKYLEHARIFYFKHSNPSYFIASADMMPRNLERRLELMCPIVDENLCLKLAEYLRLGIADTELSYELINDKYHEVSTCKCERCTSYDKKINSQEMLEDYMNKMHKTIKKSSDEAKLKQLESKLFKE